MSLAEMYESGGSHRAPSLEHARVRDAMRMGVLTCPPQTSLTTVARMLAHNHVHAIVVTRPEAESDSESRAWSVVTADDVLRGRNDPDGLTAGGMAHRNYVTVSADDPLDEAAAKLVGAGQSHAVVLARDSDLPIGMVSTLDVAGVVGWGRA